MVASKSPGTWSQVRTRSANATQVEFRFYPDYARTAWVHPRDRAPGPVTRGKPRLERETLLLDDVMFIDNQSAFARVWLIPADAPGYFHLRVELAAPTRIARNARVTLHWDHHEHHGVMRAGQLLFENISPPNFSHYLKNVPTRRLRLTFEFDDDKKSVHSKSSGQKNDSGNGHKNGSGKHQNVKKGG